jgi:hypothetical protein
VDWPVAMGWNPTVDGESRVAPHGESLARRVWFLQWKELLMDKTVVAFWLTLIGLLCWIVCFWWMHRISTKQNALLDQLHAQGKRIEKLSKIEHDLIKEVHPQVGEIKDGMDAVVAAVKENTESNAPTSKKK